MRLQTAPPATPVGSTAQPARLGQAEFSARYAQSARTLWLIAAGVMGDRSDADDVLQEAAMIAMRKLGDFDPASNFTAWMGEIVRNVARNHGRKRTRRRTASADPRTIDSSRQAPRTDAEDPALDDRGHLGHDQSAFDDEVLAALNSLDETARTCLLLRILQDLPYREISLVLGVPEGTAMSHVYRARMAMRKRLTQGDPAPGANP